MGPTVMFLVAGVGGGLLVALLTLKMHRTRSSSRPADALGKVDDTGKTDVVNAAAIRVAGVGGLGFIAMALVVAWAVPRIGQTLAVGAVLGVMFELALIVRRRHAGPMPSSGRRSGANTTLSVDEPLESEDHDERRSHPKKMGRAEPQEHPV